MRKFENPTRFACALTLLTIAVACGGGGGSGGDGGGDPGEPPTARTAVVLTSDFTTSSLATLPVEDPTAVTTDTQTFHGDAVARTFGNTVYVINRRGADNIQALDATGGYATRWQCSVEDPADPDVSQNPQDLVDAGGGKGYVSLYASGVAVVDLNPSADCSGFVRKRIDLSSLADADGRTEPTRMVVLGDRLYVTLQLLDNFAPTDSSALAVIDTTTDELVGSIALSAPNPFSETKGLPVDDDGKIYVAEVGNFGVLDGGIERVDPATGRAEGHFITEEDLGGDVNDFVIVSGSRGYAVISDADFNYSLVRFDPGSGEVQATLASGGAYLPDVEYDDSSDQIFVASQDFSNPGIHVFAADDSEVTSSPIDTGLPPFVLNFID